jgi:type IV pilus assembly protein PilM
MFGKDKNLIGIDLGSSSIKIVELKKIQKTYQLKAAMIGELPEDVIVEGKVIDFTAVVDVLKDTVKNAALSHKNVISALKGYDVISKRVDLDVDDSSNFDETFRWEANQYVDFDVNTMNIDFQRCDKDEATGKTPVILAVAKKDLINDIKFVFDSANLRLSLIDVEVFALANLFVHNYEEFAKSAIIMDIGFERVHMIFIDNSIYRFSFDVDMGIKNCIELLKQMYDINYDEALNILMEKETLVKNETNIGTINQFYDRLSQTAANIVKSVQKEGDKVYENCFICGGGAYLPGVEGALSTALNLEVKYFNPFNKIDVDKFNDKAFIEKNLYRLNIAVGLALRNMGDAK